MGAFATDRNLTEAINYRSPTVIRMGSLKGGKEENWTPAIW